MRRTLIGLIAGIAIGIALISMSGIGQAADGDAGSQNPLTSWIPDIKQIMSDAMRDIFSSAGAEIRDPGIAEFYNKLTGNMMTIIVAMLGLIMPEPLAIAPRRSVPEGNSTSAANSLGTVSVVMMAWAASRLPSLERAAVH